MSLSILQYIGSKRLDIKYYECNMPKPDDIDVSVELFGGSGYNSLYLFSKNKNIKSIINDTDKQLINFFNEIKKNPDMIINEVNNLITSNPTKEQFLKLKEQFLKKENENSNSQNATFYLFFSKFNEFRPYLYPTTKKINIIKKDDYKIFFEWIKNTDFILGDYQEIYKKIKQNKSNKKYFIFLDPPYLNSFNSYYKDYDNKNMINDNKIIKDNTEIFIEILNYLKESKKKMMLIINKNCITEYLYKKFIKGEYNKTYQLTKKKTTHLIICNY